MAVAHKKKFGVYRWEKSSYTTSLVSEADTIEDAENLVAQKYEDQISDQGHNKILIVDSNGKIVTRFPVIC